MTNTMSEQDRFNLEMDRLREGRPKRRDRAAKLGEFLGKEFERTCSKPYRRLGKLAEIWQDIVPNDLLGHTALISFQRGILTVAVDSSSNLYKLDRLLAERLLAELRDRFKSTALRRVKTIVINQAHNSHGR